MNIYYQAGLFLLFTSIASLHAEEKACISGNCEDGKGTATYENGKYSGDFQKSYFHGNGSYKWKEKEGGTYNGEFSEGLPEGQGVYIWRDKRKHQGPYSDGQPYGIGDITYDPERSYKGRFKKGHPFGFGKFIYSKEIKLRRNKSYTKKTSYSLKVKASKIPLQEEMQCESGTCKSGKGVAKYSNGSYTGTFESGLFSKARFSGEGTYKWKNGNLYTGAFQDGLPHGRGEYTWPDGKKYIGNYKKGQPNGKGEIIFKDGKSYKGSFLNGYPNSSGIFAENDSKEYIVDAKIAKIPKGAIRPGRSSRGAWFGNSFATGCDLRITSPKTEKESNAELAEFQEEFSDQDEQCGAMLRFFNGKWFVFGYNDNQEFQQSELAVDDPLVTELNKSEYARDQKKLRKLATEKTGYSYRERAAQDHNNSSGEGSSFFSKWFGSGKNKKNGGVNADAGKAGNQGSGFFSGRMAFLKSAIIPGWTQWDNGHKIKGAIFFGSFIATAGALYVSDRSYKTKRDDYNSFADALFLVPSSNLTGVLLGYSEANAKYNDFSAAGNRARNISIGLASIYLINVADAIFFSKPVANVTSAQREGLQLSAFQIAHPNFQTFENKYNFQYTRRF